MYNLTRTICFTVKTLTKQKWSSCSNSCKAAAVFEINYQEHLASHFCNILHLCCKHINVAGADLLSEFAHNFCWLCVTLVLCSAM